MSLSYSRTEFTGHTASSRYTKGRARSTSDEVYRYCLAYDDDLRYPDRVEPKIPVEDEGCGDSW